MMMRPVRSILCVKIVRKLKHAAFRKLFSIKNKGHVGIAKATPEGFNIISEFQITLGDGPHWAHPVINDGVLYIRHGTALMAFDIKQK